MSKLNAAMKNFFGAVSLVVLAVFALGAPLVSAAESGAAEGVHWQNWKAGNKLSNTASLQRGAANFVNYCLNCHSLKYMRYSRMGEDLKIGEAQLLANLVPGNAKPTDYMMSSFPAADGEAWFGRAPPDLSLTARAKGTDYIYQFLKGFYVDASKPSGTNNLALDGAAMPAVLSPLEGVKAAVFGKVDAHGGKTVLRFEQVAPGQLSPEQYDEFVRDTVNFLDYAAEPVKLHRASIGIWVVLFLMLFSAFAWMLKQEYWKDVH